MPPEPIEEARQRAEVAAAGVMAPRVISLDQVVSPSAPAAVRAWLAGHFGRSTAQATYADFLATDGFDALGRLHEIRQPTLVIGGEDDLWTPPRFQRYLAEQIPGARLVLLPSTGHYPFVEQAETFNRELEALLVGLKDNPLSPLVSQM
jgi:pimeloyl-ACP methyl ester carboxylesterase